MKLAITILTIIALSTSIVWGQHQVFLKNQKTGRLKKLKETTYFSFDIRTSDNSKLSNYGRIIQMNDSTLTVEEYVKPSMRRAATPAILTIEINDIKSIKNYLIDNDDFNIFGGMLIIGGAISLVATPVVWIANGKEAGQDGAIFTAGLLTAGGLLLLPQFIGKRRQMTKWKFVKG